MDELNKALHTSFIDKSVKPQTLPIIITNKTAN